MKYQKCKGSLKDIPQDKTEQLQKYLCEQGFPSLAEILDNPQLLI